MKSNKSTYLCIVFDRCTNDQLAEYDIEAIDDYYARKQIVEIFKNDKRYTDIQHLDWCVTSVKI